MHNSQYLKIDFNLRSLSLEVPGLRESPKHIAGLAIC